MIRLARLNGCFWNDHMNSSHLLLAQLRTTFLKSQLLETSNTLYLRFIHVLKGSLLTCATGPAPAEHLSLGQPLSRSPKLPIRAWLTESQQTMLYKTLLHCKQVIYTLQRIFIEVFDSLRWLDRVQDAIHFGGMETSPFWSWNWLIRTENYALHYWRRITADPFNWILYWYLIGILKPPIFAIRSISSFSVRNSISRISIRLTLVVIISISKYEVIIISILKYKAVLVLNFNINYYYFVYYNIDYGVKEGVFLRFSVL